MPGWFRYFALLFQDMGFMLIGALLMVVGCLLVIRNKDVAVLVGTDQRGFYTEFGNSVARQNIAIIGSLIFGAGIAMFALL